MLQPYRTVKQFGSTAWEINKSRFITYVQRVSTEEDAAEFITQIKKRHWDATHNCSAYVVGDLGQYQKADDDGEPAGTAGKPILEVIKRLELKDVVIVVTRYFGGIKLGAGGLIRAYGRAAALGIEAAGVVERVPHREMSLLIDYMLLGKVENELRTGGYRIAAINYLENVGINVLVPVGQEDAFTTKVKDWTAGQANIELLGWQYVDIPVNGQPE